MRKSDKNLFFSFTYEFLEIYMRIQLARSVATIESYRDAFTVFRHYLRDERKIRTDSFEFPHCTRDLILDFMNYLADKGNKPGTRNQRLAALKSYLWFAAEKDTTLQSVAISISRIKSCRNPQKEKPILDEQAFAAIHVAISFKRQSGNRSGILNFDKRCNWKNVRGKCGTVLKKICGCGKRRISSYS